VAYVRTVKTASGARAVQIVHSSRRGSRDIEHIGSAHDDAALEALKAVARQRLAVGQPELDFGLDFAALQAGSGAGGGPLAITSSRMEYLWDALGHAYQLLGFKEAAGGDEVFRLLVLARIVEPTSKLDSLRVVEEAGFDPPAYATLKRRLPAFAKESWRQKLAAACARTADLGPASLVLYDVSVRHEALVVRVGVRDHHRGRGRSRGRGAGGSPTGETSGRAGAAPTKPCRVRTVGWRERGERAEEVYARNRCHHLS
jgi:hypothetical protein